MQRQRDLGFGAQGFDGGGFGGGRDGMVVRDNGFGGGNIGGGFGGGNAGGGFGGGNAGGGFGGGGVRFGGARRNDEQERLENQKDQCSVGSHATILSYKV